MKPMPPPPPGKKRRSTISNPVGRKVAGNAEGRASEFYKGPKRKTTRKGSFGGEKLNNFTVGANTTIKSLNVKKTPTKRGGR
jgi:hypothetical protein